MEQPTFDEFKAGIDGKAAIIILHESRRTKLKLENAANKKRITKDKEVKRILDFCNYLQHSLNLPRGLTKEDWGFYKRTMEKLVRRGSRERYVLDVFVPTSS